MSGTIHEPETLYTSPIEPRTDDPVSVLAFLLLTERAFCQPGDDLGQLRAVQEVLHEHKRHILLSWYAQATRRSA